MIKNILIATGGTGGHIFPAYSLAKYLIKKIMMLKITTDKRGQEFLKDYKDLNLIHIPSSPIKKKILFTIFSIYYCNYLLNYKIFNIFDT